SRNGHSGRRCRADGRWEELRPPIPERNETGVATGAAGRSETDAAACRATPTRGPPLVGSNRRHSGRPRDCGAPVAFWFGRSLCRGPGEHARDRVAGARGRVDLAHVAWSG